MNEGYAPTPVEGSPLTPGGKRDAPPISETSTVAAVVVVKENPQGNNPAPASNADTPDTTTEEAETISDWGYSLAFSVEIPQGMCSSGGTDDEDGGCSQVWMYGGVAWDALRERCRLAATGQTLPSSEAAREKKNYGGRPRSAVEDLNIACSVGDFAKRTGEVWGLEAKHLSGVGPPSEVPGTKRGWDGWQRALVWSVRGLEG